MTDAPPLLRALACVLAEASGPEAAVCAAAVRRVLEGEVEGLDDAFGLKKSAAGQRSWRTVAALQRRDDLIRQAAAEHFGGLTNREAAERISSALARFRNSHDWRRSRAATTCPFTGIKSKLWNILKLIDRPLGAERIRQILGVSRSRKAKPVVKIVGNEIWLHGAVGRDIINSEGGVFHRRGRSPCACRDRQGQTGRGSPE